MFSSSHLLSRYSSISKRIAQIKNALFSKYLLFTNLGISVASSGLGDVLQQYYTIATKEKDKWDMKRSSHMCVSGLTVGFVCHHWYEYLDRKMPGRSLSIVMKKVFLDQVICSPVYITVFFVTLGILENSPMESIGREIIQKGKYLYTAEWLIWPPAQIINFAFLPTKYRILYDNTISLAYDVFTSYIKHEMDSDGS